MAPCARALFSGPSPQGSAAMPQPGTRMVTGMDTGSGLRDTPCTLHGTHTSHYSCGYTTAVSHTDSRAKHHRLHIVCTSSAHHLHT